MKRIKCGQTTALATTDKHIITGSYAQSSIKIYNYKGSHIHTFDTEDSINQNTIENGVIRNDVIISGSHNLEATNTHIASSIHGSKNIKLWNYNGELLHTLKGHSNDVISLAINDAYIISGSYDNTIKIWDYTGTCLHTIKAHKDDVNCLALSNEYFISGSSDSTIKVWDYKGQNINTFTEYFYIFDDEPSGYIEALAMNKKYIVTKTASSIKVYDYDYNLIFEKSYDDIYAVDINDKYIAVQEKRWVNIFDFMGNKIKSIAITRDSYKTNNVLSLSNIHLIHYYKNGIVVHKIDEII